MAVLCSGLLRTRASMRVLAFLLLLCACAALISTNNIAVEGPTSLFLASGFGLVQGGVINVEVQATHQALPDSPLAGLSPSALAARFPANSPSLGAYFLLVLLDGDQKRRWYGDVGSSDPATLVSLCMQPATVRRRMVLSASGAGNFSYTLPAASFVSSNSAGDGGGAQYSVALLQCHSLQSAAAARVQLALSVRTEMYNAQPGGLTGRSYLSIEDVPQIRIMQVELLLLTLLMAVLLGQIALSLKPMFALKLHGMFVGVISLGIALVSVTYAQQSGLNATGLPSAALDLAVSVTDHINTTAELLCFLLLSLGWSTTRAALTHKEVKVLAGSVSLFFVIGMVNATCVDINAAMCLELSLVTYILRLLLILAIIIAMNFTVTQLRAGLVHSPWIPSTPVQYARVKQFQMFRVIFILYLLLPTAFVVVQGSFFSWRENWVVFLLGEMLDLYVYLHVGATFSPLQEPFLIRAFDNTFTTALRQNN